MTTDQPQQHARLLKDLEEARKRVQELESELGVHGSLLAAAGPLPFPYAMLSPEGRICAANQAAAEFFGLPDLESCVGRPYLDFHPPEDHHTAHRIAETLMSGRPVPGTLIPRLLPDGTQRMTLVLGRPCFHAGKVVGADGFFFDVDHLHRAQEHLLRHQKELEQQAEEQLGRLRQERELLEQTQRLGKIGGFETFVEDRSVVWTSEVYRIFGFDYDNTPDFGQILELLDEQDRMIVLDTFKRLETEPADFDKILRLTTPAGEKKVIRSIGTPRYRDGRFHKIEGIVQDITEQARNEERLRKSEARLHLLFDQLPIGAVVVAQNVLHPNRMVETISGYCREDLESLEDWLRCHYGENAKRMGELYRSERSRDGEGRRLMLEARRRNGEPYVQELLFSRHDDHEIWLLRDISHELSQGRQARRLAKVFTESIDTILIEDLDGRILEANPSAVQTYGWTREELEGKPGAELVPEADRAELERLVAACREGRDLRQLRGRRLCRDGRVLNVLFSLSVLRDEAARPEAVACICKILDR